MLTRTREAMRCRQRRHPPSPPPNILERNAVELHQERLRMLGALAANIGHEFNNIIQTVSCSAEMATREAVSDKQKRNLERITWGFEQAQTLARQMLALARKQDVVASVINLNQAIKDFDKIISQAVKRTVKLKFDFHPNAVDIEVNRGQLELALLNLVRNASDAIEGQGTITIRTVASDKLIELSIADTGCGMDEQTATRAIEPFFSTKMDKGGTGLGLSMVFDLMVQSRGTLGIKSLPNSGTTITLSFPRH
jgi:signal transduction histidine kinase